MSYGITNFLTIIVYKTIENIHKVKYNKHMKDYCIEKTSISWIRYHLVFCPRYRRRIFLIPGVKEIFRKKAEKAGQENGIKLDTIRYGTDYVWLEVLAPPQVSVQEVVKIIRKGTAEAMKEAVPELAQMKSIWTRNYFVSTEENLPEKIVHWYVEQQKKRY